MPEGFFHSNYLNITFIELDNEKDNQKNNKPFYAN